MKKLLSLMLALMLCVSILLPAAAETTDAASFSMETVNVDTLLALGGLVVDAFPLVFINGDYSVPYITIEYYYSLINEFERLLTPGTAYAVTCTETDEGLQCTRENGSFLLFNFDDSTVYISDPDMYSASVGAVNGPDELGSSATVLKDENGNPIYDENGNPAVNLFYRVDDGSTFTCSGSPMILNLSETCITMIRTGEGTLLPLAVLNTLFSAGSHFNMVFNGNYLFLLVGYAIDDTYTDAYGNTLRDYYYDAPSTERSEALAQLNYDLLCIELDLKYGLKENHGITDSFETYFELIGLKDEMLAADGSSFVAALEKLTRSYLADFHSGLSYISPYAGSTYTSPSYGIPASTQYVNDAEVDFRAARRAAGLTADDGYGNDVILQPYMEVGDTAYITFDAFTSYGYNFYDPEIQANLESLIGEDTLALVIYAAKQINRENTPIKHVVIDLSLNGGGQVKAATFINAWLLGSANLSTENPTTGARYNVTYKVDTDLDGYITEADALDLDRFDVYCLTSLNSFSCGNLVPFCLKDSGKVTLIGQTSGGGSCMVSNTITADGTIFSYSGSSRMCSVKNGSFYNVDEGASPDFVIRKTAHFYDREWLNSFIADLP